MSNKPVNDERELVAKIRSGDPGAFRLFVERYQRLVMHVVFRLVDRAEDREELCQDVFVRAHRKLDQFAFESKLSTWLAQIAYRTCLNFLSRKRLELAEEPPPSLEQDEAGGTWLERQPAPGPSPAERLASQEASARVRDSINQLPPLLRTVVTLYHLEDMSIAEIGQCTGLAQGTIKSHLFRARQTLKERLLQQMAKERTL